MQIFSPPSRIALVFIVSLVTACSSGEPKLDVSTGWLGPLSPYTRVSGKNAAGVFVRASDTAAEPLAGVLLVPAEITVAPNSDYYSIEAAHLAAMRDSLTGILRAAIDPVVPVRDKASPTTYTLRIAFTKLTIKQPNRGSTVAALSDYRFDFGATAIEAELRDGRTNLRRAVIVTPFPAGGQRAGRDGANDRWSDLTDRFRTAATAFRVDLEIAKRALANLPAERPAAKPDAAPVK